MASRIEKHYIVYARCRSTSVLDEEMHARYTGVPRHLPRMQEVGERVEYQLYALATLDGAPEWEIQVSCGVRVCSPTRERTSRDEGISFSG